MLHIDENDFYGGPEAAFSLQEAEAWVEQVYAGKLFILWQLGKTLISREASVPTLFSHASIRKASANEEPSENKLGFSRAYSISLAPQLIYTRSNLIPALVSSKVYRQLEFLAVGSWWLYDGKEGTANSAKDTEETLAEDERPSGLRKIPGGREDVFTDESIDLRSTRSLMKFLKLAADTEAWSAVLPEWGGTSSTEYLKSQFKIDSKLEALLLALTLSQAPLSKTTVAYALPRIHRHLTSIGIFGPGFGAVIPKWGGLAEIAQVACRAGAVGGGVYVLKKGIESIESATAAADTTTTSQDADNLMSKIRLQGGDIVRARWIVGAPATLARNHDPERSTEYIETTHLTAIVSSRLTSLFLPPAEGSPPPAGVIVVLPPSSFQIPDSLDVSEVPPIYLLIHSSDTGECPEGQCMYFPTLLPSHAHT